MPLPEQAPAASPISGKTVMSWHWLVARRGLRARAVVAALPEPGDVAGGGVGEDARPIDDASPSAGAASGTWITSMLKSEVLGSSFGSAPEQPASSSPERTVLVPEP